MMGLSFGSWQLTQKALKGFFITGYQGNICTGLSHLEGDEHGQYLGASAYQRIPVF